jgi:hypothetical protein
MQTDGPTGADLYEELRVAAAAAGVTIQKFARPLFAEPNWKLEQLRIAKHPTQLTIDRVRALVTGRIIPPARPSNIKGINLRRGDPAPAGEARVPGEVIEARRRLTDLAHAERLPGETLDAAVARLQHQQSTIASLGGGQ